MTVSSSNRSLKQLWSDLLVALGGSEAFLTRDLSERQVLIEILNTFGGSFSKRTIGGRENILARIVTAAGGSASPRHSRNELLAALVTELGGTPPSPYSSSTEELVAAAVNAADTGGGGGAYVASAVHFDGATNLINSNLVAPSGSCLSYSVWINIAADATGSPVIWESDPLGNGVAFAQFLGGTPELRQLKTFYDDANTGGPPSLGATIPTGTGNLFDGVWHHLLFCGTSDLSPLADNPRVMYLDGVKFNTLNLADAGSSVFAMIFDGLPFYVGDDGQGDWFVGDMSDFWFGANVNLLVDGDIPIETLRKFIDVGGKPVDPSGFPSGAVLLSGDAATFGANQGTGGAFTLTGTLTNATTSPSD